MRSFALSGNGVDIGAVYQAIMALSSDLRGLRAEMNMRFERLGTELQAEIAEVRDMLRDYHGSVVGHGILLTEHDERLTRLEQAREP